MKLIFLEIHFTGLLSSRKRMSEREITPLSDILKLPVFFLSRPVCFLCCILRDFCLNLFRIEETDDKEINDLDYQERAEYDCRFPDQVFVKQMR